MPRSNPSTKHLGNLSSETTRDYVRLRARRRCWSGAFSCQPWPAMVHGQESEESEESEESQYINDAPHDAPHAPLWPQLQHSACERRHSTFRTSLLHPHPYIYIVLHSFYIHILHPFYMLSMTKLFLLGKRIDLTSVCSAKIAWLT